MFKNVGLDRAFKSEKDTWLEPFMKLNLQSYVVSFFQDIDEKSSLHWYRTMKRSTFGEKYMSHLNNFQGTRLKFKARLGCLGLKEDLRRWNGSNTRCDLCNEAAEDLVHFLFLCPSLNSIRLKYYHQLEQILRCKGAHDV